jgi:hypothetical protein
MMSIRNTKRPLYHIWHVNTENSPLGMMMGKQRRRCTHNTIVDQGCSQAVVFLPCSTKIMGLGIAQLYHDHVFQWFGLPTKVISDRDPRFTSHFSKALTMRLGIKQNISTAFHPQTDGLSEQKNQWIEQYLRLVTSAAPEDWTQWLVLASAIHNN